MKAHIGVDAESGLTHTVVTTAANVSDITQAHALLHGEETTAFGDAGYQGVEKREENRASEVSWYVALRPGRRRALPINESGRLCEQVEQIKASIRTKVEPPFLFVKDVFALREGALSRTGEECGTTLHAVWPGESADRQATIVCA